MTGLRTFEPPALTANVLPQPCESYLAAGMNGVVAKPLSVTDLVHEISRFVSQDGSSAKA